MIDNILFNTFQHIVLRIKIRIQCGTKIVNIFSYYSFYDVYLEKQKSMSQCLCFCYKT